MLYSFSLTGDFFLIFNVQKAWGKFFNINPTVFLSSFNNVHYMRLIIINSEVAFWGLLCAVWGAIDLGFSGIFIVFAYSLIHVFTTSQFWHVFSYSRYVVILFPMFFALAKLAKNSKFMDVLLTLVLSIMQIYLFTLWVNGTPVPM
jgi:hypothetical protein